MLFLWALLLDAIQMLLHRTKGITQRRLWDAAAGQSKALEEESAIHRRHGPKITHPKT